MAQRILALELSSNVVRAATAERAWNSFNLTGTYKDERRPGEADLSAALARLMAHVGTPDIVISALPGELVAKRLLTLPFHDRRRLDQAVPFALEEHLPFAVEDSVVTFITVGREGDSSLVIAALVRKADLRAHLDLLVKAGLDPKTVTLSALSLPALVSRASNGRSQRHLLLDLDLERTSLVLLDVGGTPRAIRTITVGLESGGNTLGQQAAAGTILTTIRQTMLSHADIAAPSDLILSGAAAVLPEIKSELSKALEIPVRGADELDYSPLFDRLHPDELPFAGCLAMLLGELPSSPAQILNFRQGEFAFRGRVSDLRPLYTSGILAAAVAATAFFHFCFGIYLNLHRLGVLSEQVSVIAAPALGSDLPADPKAVLSARIAEMNKRLRLFGGGGRTSPLEVLQALSAAIPSRLPMDVDEMLIDEGGVKLVGRADSFATIDQIKKALGQSPLFTDIQVTDAKVGAELNKVQFRLSAAVKDNPGGA